MTPDREEALRLAREWLKEEAPNGVDVADVFVLARALLALAADLEAAERERDACIGAHRGLEVTCAAVERDLATAREALEVILRVCALRNVNAIALAALRSLDGEPTTQASADRGSGEAVQTTEGKVS